MNAAAALAATATLVSTAFCLSTLERWLRNERPHELAWTVALAMFTVAGLAYLWAAATGWGPVAFRIFYLFGAILNVAWLALGTVYLLAGERVGDVARWWLTVLSAFCAGVVLSAPIEGSLAGEGIPTGREVLGTVPRVMAAVGSGLGATVIVLGALWSAIRLLGSRRTRPSPATSAVGAGRLALTNVLIATGALVLGAGGTLFGTGDEMVGFGIWLAVGVGILFVGFLVSNPPVGRPESGELDPYWRGIREIIAGEALPDTSA